MDRKRTKATALAVVVTLIAFGALGSVVFGADSPPSQGSGTPAAPQFVPAQDQAPAPPPDGRRHRGPCKHGDGDSPGQGAD